MSKELLLQPVVITRDTDQQCQIEPSINSVRVSQKIKQSDALEKILVDKFSRFIAMRAEEFQILRRCPVPGYNISFLITNFHLDSLRKRQVIDFIIHFIKEIDGEIASLKLNVNARARIVAGVFFNQFGN